MQKVPASHMWGFAAAVYPWVSGLLFWQNQLSDLHFESVQTLLSSAFRLYGSLPWWKRDFLNLSTTLRLMLWCGAGGSWRWKIDKWFKSAFHSRTRMKHDLFFCRLMATWFKVFMDWVYRNQSNQIWTDDMCLRHDTTIVVVLLYLRDVNNFVQLHEEPLNGIINLPNFLLGDANPRWHWSESKARHTNWDWGQINKRDIRSLGLLCLYRLISS